MMNSDSRAGLHLLTVDYIQLVQQRYPGVQPLDLVAAMLSATIPILVDEVGAEEATRRTRWLTDQVVASGLAGRAPDDAPSLAIPGHNAALGADGQALSPARGGAQGAQLEGQGGGGHVRPGLADDFVVDRQNRRAKTGCLDC